MTQDLASGGIPEDSSDAGLLEQMGKLDTGIPHIARIYDFWLGGKDHFAADRAVAEQMSQVSPHIAEGVRANRAFLQRAVRYLAAEAGVRQFLDIGTGLPSPGNTHEIAQSVAPTARVVYTDNDPIVLAHARALLASGPQGATSYVDGDFREPAKILSGAQEVLDFSQPAAIILGALLHVIADDEDPYGLVGTLVAAVPPGSYLVISHGATDIEPERMAELSAKLNAAMPAGQRPAFRDRAAVTAFFDGLDLVDPGVAPVTEWRPDAGTKADPDVPVALWGAVGRKPA